MDIEENFDYNNKCSFESLYIGLKCKNSSLLMKYNIEDIKDLYKLCKDGNDTNPSLLNHNRIKEIYNNSPEIGKKIIDEISYKLQNDINGFNQFIFVCFALYFHIHIHFFENGEFNEEMSGINKNIENPNEIIKVQFTSKHVEYVPENENEQKIYDEIKINIDQIIVNKDISNKELDYMLGEKNSSDDEDIFNISDINYIF